MHLYTFICCYRNVKMNNNYINVLRKAIKDPKIPKLDCICSSNKSRLIKLVQEVPKHAHISEWRYGLGKIRYNYHLHTIKKSSRKWGQWWPP